MVMPSSIAALARPVRRVLNSRCRASMAPCMRWVTSLITSLIMSCLSIANDRPDLLAHERAADVALLAQRENIDRDAAAAGQIDGRGVHHLEPLGQHALIGGVRDLDGVGVLLRIGGVDAVELGCVEDDL